MPAARLPGGLGKVLQVVSTNNGTVFSTSSSSYVDVSGQSVTITPSATSSKVLGDFRLYYRYLLVIIRYIVFN